MRALAPCSVALALALEASAGGAQTRPRDVQLAMGASLAWDAGFVLAGGAMALGGLALSPPTVDVAPFDGLGARPWRPEVSTVTDVALWGGLAVTVGLGVVVERWGRDARGVALLGAPLVLAESAVVTLGVVSILKNVAGECRPRAWSDATNTCASAEREDRVSFPSGHTAPLAAMAGASLGMMAFPTGGRGAYWPLLATAGALAVTNLVLRVVAGAHNWVDTTAGFALGFSIGLGTSALHTYPAPVSVGASAQGVTVSGAL